MLLRTVVNAVAQQQPQAGLWLQRLAVAAAATPTRALAAAAAHAQGTDAGRPCPRGGPASTSQTTAAATAAQRAHQHSPWPLQHPMRRGFATQAGSSSGGGAEGSSSGNGASQSGTGLLLDDSAVQRLHQLKAQAGDGKDLLLRIEVEGGGCSGFQYKFRLDGEVAPDDRVFERDGARVVTDPVSLEFLKGAVIEFEDSLMRSAFQIASNPNSESTCGCGSSFVAKGG